MNCKKMIVVSTLALAICLALAGGASAAFIGAYVAATPTNTAPSSAYGPTSADTDNLWWYTANEGGLNYFFSNSVAENCPVLTTTISGLALGSYEVYGVWNWYPNSGGGVSMLNASLNDQPWIGYTMANSGNPTGRTNSWLAEYEILLGRVDNVTGFTVQTDDWYANSLFGLYSGISYKSVPAVPEPSAMIALMSGLAGMVAIRRRK